MSDHPVFVPGRPNRKLRAMVAELDDLRRQGWSSADIHRSLAARGITVDYTTVRREIRKLEKRAVTEMPSPAAVVSDAPALGANPSGQPETSENKKPAGKSKVDEFFDTYQDNPILDKLDRQRKKP